MKEAFLDENADEQVLMELKQLWEKKLADSKAIEPQEPPAPLVKVSLPYHFQNRRKFRNYMGIYSALSRSLLGPSSRVKTRPG